MQFYVLRRLLATIPVLFVVALVAFALLRLTPGDAAHVMAGVEATPDEVEEIRKDLGLDRPLPVQLGIFLGQLVRGDLGKSITTKIPVTRMIRQRLEPTLSITILTEIFAISVAVPMGVLAAWKANTWIDRVVMVFAAVGYSMPVFWLGFILIWIFSLWAFGQDSPIFPVASYSPLRDGFVEYMRHLALPVLALGILLMSLITRMTRASMLEVLREDYVRTARAKGLGERLVLLRYALRNASLPIVTVIGLGFGGLITGVVVAESVFAIPGLGRLIVDGIRRRDYPVIQAMLIVTAGAYVFVNLAVDLLYAYLDPRIRY